MNFSCRKISKALWISVFLLLIFHPDVEANNYLLRPLAASELHVDLRFGEVELPDTLGLSPETQTEFKFLVNNDGIDPLEDTLFFAIFISPDGDLDQASDLPMGAWEKIIQIPAGDSVEIDAILNIPDTLAMGTYHLFLVLDSENEVEETNEENNIFGNILELLEPDVDLVISKLSPVGDTMTLNTWIDLEFDLENRGKTSTMLPSTCEFYLSSDSLVDSKDLILKSIETPRVFGGETEQVSHSVWVKGVVDVGYYYLIAVADASEEVVETDEGNNMQWSRDYYQAPGIDLVTTDVSINPNPVDPLVWMAVNFKFRNLGDAYLSYRSKQRFYISSDTLLDEADHLFAEMRMEPLESYKETSAGTSSALKIGEPNFYYMLVVTDYDGAITEMNEDNNVSWARFRIRGHIKMPDYTIESYELNWDTDSVELNLMVSNMGDKAAQTPVAYRAIYSRDELGDSTDITVSSAYFKAMDKGESQVHSLKLSLADRVPGLLWIIIDPEDQLEELDEGNNAFSIKLPEGPYDIGCKLSLPGNVFRPGDTLAVQTELSNESMLLSDSVSLSFWFSVDGNLDFSDQLLSETMSKPMDPQEIRSLIQDLIIPGELNDGVYSILVLAHEAFMHEETNRDNNLDSASFTIDHTLGGADLYLEKGGISIYPNPASEILNIESSDHINRYKIINSAGAELLSGQLDAKKGSLSLAALSDGSYFLLIEHREGKKVLKFKIVH